MKNTHHAKRPATNISRLAVSALFTLLILGLSGCAKSTQITTSAGGHPIYAEIVGNHAIDSQAGTISSPYGTITIERARAKFDDAQWTAIPEGVPVKVKIAKGKLWLAAGSVTIKRTIN